MNALYLDNPYLKEFEAKVLEVEREGNNIRVILNKTAFYPGGGGQPCDTGFLIKKNGECVRVVSVRKIGNKIVHEIETGGISEGEEVTGKIDWDRRYKLMRMHTAAHLLSACFYEEGALITGNQLGEDRSRIDFSLKNFDKEKIKRYVKKANLLIDKGAKIKFYWISRGEALKNPEFAKLAKGLPNLDKLRIVEIEGIDKQADGGCHVNNLREIGKIEFIKAENKGKLNRRIYFTLKD